MSKNINQVLIVSDAGRLRDSLRVLLKSCYPLAIIVEAETSLAALQLLAGSSRTLVLVDAALSDGQAWQALNQIGKRLPQAQCVVLTHSFEHQKQAGSAGAVAVELDGLTAEYLSAAVEASTQG
jgi:DNA-binding NarL/FixJ family response regulator